MKQAVQIFKDWINNYHKYNRKNEMWNYLKLDVINKMECLAEYYNISRNEKFTTDLIREYPDVKNYTGNIEDEGWMVLLFKPCLKIIFLFTVQIYVILFTKILPFF